jgi:hypothetical protein
MINNTPDSKLDETIKNTLNNYEAQYDASDWSRMETMLDAAPKSVNFKWSHAITVIIGIAVIGGGYALYNAFSGPSGSSTEVSTTPPPVAPENTPKENTNTLTTTAGSAPKQDIPSVTPEKILTPVISTPENTEPKVLVKEEKKKEKKTSPDKSADPRPIIEQNDKVLGMGNEPIFGDMLDSSKGIVGETREKEETKKAAKAKKNTPVGWNNFMLPNVNADSLKKNREKRDSLKTDQ